jgi:hypothetical protein
VRRLAILKHEDQLVTASVEGALAAVVFDPNAKILDRQSDRSAGGLQLVVVSPVHTDVKNGPFATNGLRLGQERAQALEVAPSGSKRWMLRVIVQGRRRDIGLGSPASPTQGLLRRCKEPHEGGSRRHSITQSARARSSGEIVTPRVRAVRRLSESSKRAGCSIGRLPGWAPFRTLST